MIKGGWISLLKKISGYVVTIVVGVFTQFVTNDPKAVFVVSFLVGLALNRLTGARGRSVSEQRPRASFDLRRQVETSLRKPIERAKSISMPKPRESHDRSPQVEPPLREPVKYQPRSMSTVMKTVEAKYVKGHSVFPKKRKVTLRIMPELIEIPELGLNIPYDRIEKVESIKHRKMATMKMYSLGSGVSMAIFLAFNSIVMYYYYFRKRYMMLTYVDELGQRQMPVFDFKGIDEVQPIIYRMISESRTASTIQPQEQGEGWSRAQFEPQGERLGPPSPPSTQGAREQATSPTYQRQPETRDVPPLDDDKKERIAKRYSRDEINSAYRNMKDQLERMLISEESFSNYVQGLRFVDDSGRMWTIGKDSGNWYMLDGQTWRLLDPPDHLLKVD